MRKVQIVRRPVVLSLGPHPSAKGTPPDPVPAFAADRLDDLDGQTVLDADDVMDAAESLDGLHDPAGSDAFDAIEDADVEDEPTIVTAITPAISTPRTSTSTVSASKRLEVIRQSRARKA